MGDSNKPRRSSSDDILVGKHEAVYAPVATLAEALGLRHDNLPRDELVAQTATAALREIRRLEQQAAEAAGEPLQISRQSGKRFLLVLQPRAYASLRSEVREQIPLPLKGLTQSTEADFSRSTIGGIPFVVGEEVSGRNIPDWFLLEVKEQ